MTYEQVLKVQTNYWYRVSRSAQDQHKAFSGADNDARDASPNTTVSPICFGFPGVLPVLNDEALTLAIRAGLALNSEIPEWSKDVNTISTQTSLRGTRQPSSMSR